MLYSISFSVGGGGDARVKRLMFVDIACRAEGPVRLSIKRLAVGTDGSLGVHQQGDNQTVKTQDFGENENKNHSDEETRLLGSSSNTSITDNTNGETSSETSKTDRETSTELDESGVERKLLLEVVGNQDGDDETVDTNDTSHNDGNNVLDDEVRAEDTHGGNTDTRLGGTVGSTDAGEDDSGGAAHSTKEGRVDGAELRRHICGVY